MGKARNGGQKGGKPQTAKAIKEGQVQKKKAPPAFKQTPKGKVALINGKKNGNVNTQKPQLDKAPANSATKKRNDVNTKLNSPNKQSPQKKKKNNQKAAKVVADEESDSDEDINEGISIAEQVSVIGEDDDDSSDDESTPNILGDSLADESDDDDDDFEADSEDEEVNKGVTMFKGIKSTSKNSSLEKMDEDDEDEDEDEDDDDDGEDVASANVTASSLNTSGDTSLTMDSSIADDDDEEDEDDDDEDEDEDDDDDESPGLKALLGKSLVDDEDDEDFNDDDHEEEDDDDDIDDSEENEDDESQSEKNTSTLSTASQEERKFLTPEEKAERDRRTIYIGNVPKDMKEARIKNEFRKYGVIESLRVRGVVPDSPKKSYKMAAIKKQIHAKVTSICVFIVYKTEESAKAALAMNGKLFDGNYLRVDGASQSKEFDTKKTVFLGNVPFDIEDNELWELFGKCGKIEYVRTIRDRQTGACRGVGYVSFKTADAATLALDLTGSKLRSREIRVERYQIPTDKKPKSQMGGKKRSKPGHYNSPSPKKARTNETGASNLTRNPTKGMNKKSKRSQGENQRSPSGNGKTESKGSFQGQHAQAKNNGKKFNKFEKKKKAMAGKLMAKPNRPTA